MPTKIFSFIGNLLMPAQCFVCGKIIARRTFICPDCYKKVNMISGVGCPRCGRIYELDRDNGCVCPRCLKKPAAFKSLRAALIYDDASKEIILAFKHADRTDMTPFLGNLMYQQGTEMLEDADVVMGVPLHRWRLLHRKYNQAGLLAQYLAKKSGKTFLPNTLRRVVNTPSQGHASPTERKRHVTGAFVVHKPRHIKGKSVVLVDDVYTTGATLNECARTLYRAGAKSVDALILARVQHTSSV